MSITGRAFRQAVRNLTDHFNSLRLHCVPVDDDDGVASLRSVWYRYALRPDEHREPVFRWEYMREPEGDDAFWARHHIQGPAPINLGSQYVSLNALHVPTGLVQIEEVVRFCVNDLGALPLSGDWDAILRASAGVSQSPAG